jgi:hypothetical protein
VYEGKLFILGKVTDIHFKKCQHIRVEICWHAVGHVLTSLLSLQIMPKVCCQRKYFCCQ